LNKAISALLDLMAMPLNVLLFARMLGMETGRRLLKRLSDAVFNLMSLSWFDV